MNAQFFTIELFFTALFNLGEITQNLFQLLPGLMVQGQPIDTAEALINQLHDIQTPNPIGVWPPAIGWWIITAGSLSLLFSAIYFLTAKYIKNRYRKTALVKLSLITDSEVSPANFLTQINGLLKQVFFTAYPHHRNQVSSSVGKDWYQQLLQQVPASYSTYSPAFTTWANAQYSPDSEYDKAELISFAEMWIKQHSSKYCESTPNTTTNGTQTKIQTPGVNQ